MALIKCSECRKEISDTTKKCVYCGHKRNGSNKRKIIIVIVVFILLLLLVIILSKNIKDKQTISQINDNEIHHDLKYKNIESINIDEYLKIKEEKKISVIYIYTNNCEYCTKEKSILYNIISNYNLKIYGLNYGNMNKNEKERFNLSDEYFNGGMFGTPFIAITENNKIIETVEGVESQELFENLFQKYKLI